MFLVKTKCTYYLYGVCMLASLADTNTSYGVPKRNEVSPLPKGGFTPEDTPSSKMMGYLSCANGIRHLWWLSR